MGSVCWIIAIRSRSLILQYKLVWGRRNIFRETRDYWIAKYPTTPIVSGILHSWQVPCQPCGLARLCMHPYKIGLQLTCAVYCCDGGIYFMHNCAHVSSWQLCIILYPCPELTIGVILYQCPQLTADFSSPSIYIVLPLWPLLPGAWPIAYTDTSPSQCPYAVCS